MTESAVKAGALVLDEERIQRVVTVLARAACQDFSQRLEIEERDDAFLEVEVGLNILMDDLMRAKEQSDEQLREIERQSAEISERQAMALRELATPIITVAQGILALPIIGAVDSERAATMMETLLERVVAEQASHVIIDITGITVIDTRTAEHFVRMAKAVRLLGAECFITGISPATAQTIAALGIDTSGTRTLRTLADALKRAQGELAESRAWLGRNGSGAGAARPREETSGDAD